MRGFGRGPGGLPSSWGNEPVEAVEVIAQPLFGVVLRVAQDADRAVVAAGTDGSQQLEVEGTLAQRQDLAAVAVAFLVHAVNAEGAQVRHDLAEQRREAVEVVVPMMKVVDDADVGDALALQSLDDRDLVLGLAEPAAMVVESQRAADLGGLFGERAQLRPRRRRRVSPVRRRSHGRRRNRAGPRGRLSGRGV